MSENFYEVMRGPMTQHAVWAASDLQNLLAAVPKGSIGPQAVSNYWCPARDEARCPNNLESLKFFCENGIRIVGWEFPRRPVLSGELALLKSHKSWLKSLTIWVSSFEQLRIVESFTELRELSLDYLSLQGCPMVVEDGVEFVVPSKVVDLRVDKDWRGHAKLSVRLSGALLRNLTDLMLRRCRIVQFDFTMAENLKWLFLDKCDFGAAQGVDLRVPDSVEDLWLEEVPAIGSISFGNNSAMRQCNLCALENLARVNSLDGLPKFNPAGLSGVRDGSHQSWYRAEVRR